MEYIEILKWPFVALVALYILRKPIKELILNIADFSITKDGLSARIARSSDKILNNKLTKAIKLDNPSEGYVSKNKEGEVSFDYSNNNGIYTIGKDDYRFDTQWSKASKEYVHFYNDPSTIKSVRLVKDVYDLDKVQPEKYDSSSRARTAGIGQIAVFENNSGKFLAIKILGIKDDSRGDDSDELHLKYKVLD
jgi:hypothetical protein